MTASVEDGDTKHPRERMTSIQSRTCRKGICWSLARILECICGLAFREHISRVAIQCCTACSLLEACCVRNVPRPVFRGSCRVPCSACISMFCHLCSVGSGRVLPASCRSMPAVCVLLLQDLSGPSRKQVMPKTRLRATSTTCVTPSPPGSRLTRKRTCAQPFPRSSTVSRYVCVVSSTVFCVLFEYLVCTYVATHTVPPFLVCNTVLPFLPVALPAATAHTTAASVLWCTCACHAHACCVRWRGRTGLSFYRASRVGKTETPCAFPPLRSERLIYASSPRNGCTQMEKM